jgi:hypothetical protein
MKSKLLFAVLLLAFLAVFARSRLLDNEIDRASEIACDESKWGVSSKFDSQAWRERRGREKYIGFLKTELEGKTRDQVEVLLGQPTHDLMKSKTYSYGYLLGRAPYAECGLVLSQWFVVYFDRDLNVARTEIYREH